MVLFECAIPDKIKADYLLCDCNWCAVIEAKKTSINLAEAEARAKGYAQKIKVPYIFLANGEEIRLREWQREALPRPIKTLFSQNEFERRAATALVKRDPLPVIVPPIAYQDQFRERIASIEAVIDQRNTATVRTGQLLATFLASTFSGNRACAQAASMEAVA